MLATVVVGSFLVTIYGGDVYFPFVLFVASVVFAYADDLSSDNWWGAFGVLIGPPIVALAVLLFLKLPRRRLG